MFERTEKYTKDRLNTIVFIELRKEMEESDARLGLLRDIPLPIHAKDLTDIVTTEETVDEISLDIVVNAMISLIGLDSNFKYIPQYKEFLYQYDPDIESYIGYKGVKLAEEGQLWDALIYFKTLFKLNEDNINGLYNYAKCCQDIAQSEENEEKCKDLKKEAMNVFEKITERHPDFPSAYYYLGFYYANQKLFKKAQLTWDMFLELSEGSDLDEEKKQEIILHLKGIEEDAQYEEGYLLILNEQPRLGLAKLKPLLKKHPDRWNLLFFMGLGHRGLGEAEQAIVYFEKALAIQPARAEILNELGLSHILLNEYTKAEKYFLKALRIKEDDSEVLCNLGIAYMGQKKNELAKEMLQNSLRLDPENERAIQCLENLNLYYQ